MRREPAWHRTYSNATRKNTWLQSNNIDTPHYNMIRNSLDKPVYKEKLRLRSYGVPEEDDTVYIELKKKYDGVVYKRRVPMPLCDARKYLYYGIRPEAGGQILQEVDYTVRLYRPRPVVYLAYERIAFFWCVEGFLPEEKNYSRREKWKVRKMT